MANISLVIPTYRNPKYLDICLQSAVEGRTDDSEIIVAIDGFIDESKEVLDKYKDDIKVLDLVNNQGMQMALNLGVMNASAEHIMIINDDNVLCKGWDSIWADVGDKEVITINQIEPTGPGMFKFPVRDLGRTPDKFDYEGFKAYEKKISSNQVSDAGGIFPFAMKKKEYMMVGGFDTLYKSPFICDWDFFLKLELAGCDFSRTHSLHFYHFGSAATKNRGGDQDEIVFKASEAPAADLFEYKWGIRPKLYANNSHNPKTGNMVKGIKF